MEHDEIEGTGNVTAEKPQRATTPPAYFCEEWSTRTRFRGARELIIRPIGRPHSRVATVTHHTSDETFRKGVIHHKVANCEAWRRFASELVDTCRAMLSGEFDLSATPTTVTSFGLRKTDPNSIDILWKLPTGGVHVEQLHDVQPCGLCEECEASSARSWVYFVQSATGGPVKIGYSANPSSRLSSLRSGSAGDLRIVAFTPGGVEEERMLHRLFARHRIRPRGEWFHPAPAILALIAELAEVSPP